MVPAMGGVNSLWGVQAHSSQYTDGVSPGRLLLACTSSARDLTALASHVLCPQGVLSMHAKAEDDLGRCFPACNPLDW